MLSVQIISAPPHEQPKRRLVEGADNPHSLIFRRLGNLEGSRGGATHPWTLEACLIASSPSPSEPARTEIAAITFDAQLVVPADTRGEVNNLVGVVPAI